MTPERWQRVQEVFEAARASAAGPERDRILEKECDQDPVLQQEVESLLTASEERDGTGQLLEGWWAPVLHSLTESGMEGRRIGPYRILRLIGAGGMGAVFLAERDDEQFHQLVALKLARSDVGSRDLLDRFLRERQILANLNHPNIARLLDGGVSDEGRSYFAMEYVEGDPIDLYCDGHALNVTARLVLFLEVCDAVEYAHRNLIVHRDLKPSNILVTTDGKLRLLDFGIAKLLAGGDERYSEGVAARTAHLWVTPAYASPEQIAGKPITTATDVYSLGVLLYELLSGHLPYDLESRSPAEAERIVTEESPPRPSEMCRDPRKTVDASGTPLVQSPEEIGRARGTRPERLGRRLSGDLDTIVLRALHKAPDRRYDSVMRLADDIRRHLGGLPVRARPDSISYRIRKFAWRHRVGVAAALLVFISLVAGMAGTSWQARVAERERDRAQVAAAKAEQINAFIQGMLSSVDPEHGGGRDVTVREALDEAAKTVATEFEQQPEVEAAVRSTIGRTYMNLGLYDEAETHLTGALEIRRRLHGENHVEVSENLDDLATLHLHLGSYPEAERLFRQALETSRRALGDDDPNVVFAMNNLAVILKNQGKTAEAAPLFQEALDRSRRIFGTDHLSTAAATVNLGQCLDDQGKIEEAESLLREAIGIYRSQPSASTNPDLARAINNLALLQRRRGEYGKAEDLAREVLAMKRKIHGDEHRGVALSLHNLGMLLREKGEAAEAESLLWAALAMYERLLVTDHPDVAATLQGLGSVLVHRGEPEEAEPLLRRSLEINTPLLAPEDPRLALTENVLGAALSAQGRFADAEVLLLRSESVIAPSPAVANVYKRDSLRRIAELYERWGHPEKAAPYLASLEKLTRDQTAPTAGRSPR